MAYREFYRHGKVAIHLNKGGGMIYGVWYCGESVLFIGRSRGNLYID